MDYSCTIRAIADLTRLQLRVAINETKIANIRRGQPVNIRLDALRDTKVKGRVTRINPFPEPQGFGSGGIKQYGVVVAIIEPPKSIRIGMTAFAEIDVSGKPKE